VRPCLNLNDLDNLAQNFNTSSLSFRPNALIWNLQTNAGGKLPLRYLGSSLVKLAENCSSTTGFLKQCRTKQSCIAPKYSGFPPVALQGKSLERKCLRGFKLLISRCFQLMMLWILNFNCCMFCLWCHPGWLDGHEAYYDWKIEWHMFNYYSVFVAAPTREGIRFQLSLSLCWIMCMLTLISFCQCAYTNKHTDPLGRSDYWIRVLIGISTLTASFMMLPIPAQNCKELELLFKACAGAENINFMWFKSTYEVLFWHEKLPMSNNTSLA